MKINTDIPVTGKLSIKIIDALTGQVLEEEVGENRILNSGLNLIARTISNPDYPAVAYLQLGGDASTPTAGDTPKTNSYGVITGELTTAPSEVFPVEFYYPGTGSVIFKCIINVDQGNSSIEGVGKTYQEAVLLAKPSTGPYIWFARKTFGPKTKNKTLLFEVTWTVSFTFVSI